MDADRAFEQLADRYLRESPSYSPVGATWLGDHRFDGQLDDVSASARQSREAFAQAALDELDAIPRESLSRAHQVDAAMLGHKLQAELWHSRTLQEWAWNPLRYTGLAGGALYSLLARDFAPLPDRLLSATARLKELPRLLDQVRQTLEPARVPAVHAETAVQQNRGVVSIMDQMLAPHADSLGPADRAELTAAMDTARTAVEQHQQWLESDLLPKARGDFRLGEELYDRKLSLALNTHLSRQSVRRRAEAELAHTREQMYETALEVYRETYPRTRVPAKPAPEFRQAVIRAALEQAYSQTPPADRLVEVARESLAELTAFVRDRDLVTLPPEPVEIIPMPEFRRGVTLAYCDSPGPLEKGQRTFYAISPMPEDWTGQQVRSFLREYNLRSLSNLTIHEAMPGHYLQLGHSNAYDSPLRAMLSSGVFIEGWAVYTERMMVDAGWMDGDPLMRLIMLKWYLRCIGNALLDQAVHVDGIEEDEAMTRMMEDTFQEEREAAGKWTRAKLTSAQLSTYFVGYLEHAALRQETERTWGESFALKRYHDALLSFGSPPPQYARALLLDLPIE